MNFENCKPKNNNDINLNFSNDNLPSLKNTVYSKFKRPRRGQKFKKLPTNLWNTYFRCIEYPEGIYIDEKGMPDFNKVKGSIDEADVTDEEFETFSARKKKKLLRQLKAEKKEEEEDLEYDRQCRKEQYDTESLEVDADFVEYLNGDQDYIPSQNTSDTESSENEECDSDLGDHEEEFDDFTEEEESFSDEEDNFSDTDKIFSEKNQKESILESGNDCSKK
jgi:hypothetical protein